MANQIDKQKVTLGQMIRVANLEKKFNENDKYVSLQVEDEDGNNERCLLFTEIELSDMQKVELPFDMVLGRIYKCVIDKKPTNLIKVINYYDKQMILRISPYQLNFSESRALRNPEDLTKKGLLTDLMD